MKQKYFTEEDKRAAKIMYQKKRNESRKNTPIERAKYLVDNYKHQDKLYKRGEGDLTAKWVLENIFTKPCAHCGETDWHKIGCNRLDNTKPHSKDNVEPCCAECNVELEHPKKQLDQIDKITGEVVCTWNSTMDARRGGFIHASCVALGKRKQDKGYIFKFIEPYYA